MTMSKVRVYLASQYGRRLELAKYRDEAVAAGIEVTANWLNGEEDKTPEARQRYARIDLADIDACDILISFTEHRDAPTRRGGRHVEFGYALAKGKEVWCMPYRENIFMELPEVKCFETWDHCLQQLQRIANNEHPGRENP
jgi:nucleoside 2-deoxyribosyltransferase